jgi:hypothetical protein
MLRGTSTSGRYLQGANLELYRCQDELRCRPSCDNLGRYKNYGLPGKFSWSFVENRILSKLLMDLRSISRPSTALDAVLINQRLLFAYIDGYRTAPAFMLVLLHYFIACSCAYPAVKLLLPLPRAGRHLPWQQLPYAFLERCVGKTLPPET